MTPIEHAREIALTVGTKILRELADDQVPEIGIVLGTGWGNALVFHDHKAKFFDEIGFPQRFLQPIEGHARKVICGKIAGKRVIALSGRIHLNEHSTDPNIPEMVRLQIQMMLEMGVHKFIITNAAGSLKAECRVGDVVVADGFVTLFAPAMPLFAGEFCSPEDKLSPRMREIALEAKVHKDDKILLTHQGGYVMLRGSFFEGRRYDKAFLRLTGASSVGMSTLPEMCVVALYPKAEALCLSLITNTDSEEHSHESNQARAKQASPLLGAYLEQIIRQI
ncbi:MAG: hypothetical protein WC762_13725 [Methylobacter sp.]